MRKLIIRIVLVLIVLVPAVGISWWWARHYWPAPSTFTVSTGDLISGVTVSGTLRSRQKVAVTSEVTAAIKRLAVREGQKVSPQEVLMELDDRVIAAECARAAAQRELAKHSLEELKAGPRKEEITQAKEAQNRAESSLQYEESQVKRFAEAIKRGAAAAAELELAQSRLKTAQAEVGYAKAQLDLLLAGTRPEQIAKAEAEVDLAQADADRLTALRLKYTLRAPHSGTVTVKYVNEGEVVSPGQVLLRVENIDSVEVRAQVQESQLQGVSNGSSARVLADAYPDRPMEAKVEEILPRVDPDSGTVTVLLRLQGTPSVQLMDGMAVDTAFIHQQKSGVIRIPVEALEGSGSKASVWVRSGGGFVRRAVVAGVNDGKWVEIQSGLKVGEVLRLP